MIMIQAEIHPSAWCKTVKPQLKGTIGAWLDTIKRLDLSWEDFYKTFLDNFENVNFCSGLRAEFISVHQSPYQPRMEFVLGENQLTRRMNTGLSETELVDVIAGLTRDCFRTQFLKRETPGYSFRTQELTKCTDRILAFSSGFR